METQLEIQCIFWWPELLLFVRDIWTQLQNHFSFWVLLHFVGELSEQVSVDDLIFDGFFFVMSDQFLFMGFFIYCNRPFNGRSVVFWNFGVFGKKVFFGKVLPQLVPNDSDGGIDENDAVWMWIHM